MSAGSTGLLDAARERVRLALGAVSLELESAGMPSPEWTGQLIRPLMGLAAAGGTAAGAEDVDPRVWRALAAVQLAHEASLLHDDVIDGARERRGRPTVAASRGVAAALVEGDHLLTSSYRVAAATESAAWVELFARSVERTVAGEKAQARSAGRELRWEEYEALVLGKSGELVGAAFAAAATLRDDPDRLRYEEVGCRIGLVYQMLDDLLDYCPHVETGKPPLGDYRRGLWTWPRLYLELEPGLSDDQVARRLRAPGGDGRTALARCLGRFRAEVETTRRRVTALLPADPLVDALLSEWLDVASAAARPAAAPVELPRVAGWESLMQEHAKSFRFASRLFPADRREQVTSVYAWCRYTDDLVDGVDLPAAELEARLDAWLDLSRRAYEGERTGNALADRVMSEMREADVPFGYAEELIEGMRMDVRGVEYGTVAELRLYTYRVASVVGLWMTELFGIRDPWLLDRAAALGHAMQLTNILRDVGDDLAEGRLYLPAAWLRAVGLTRADLERMAETGRIEPAYRAVIERLLRLAESEYDHAFPAIARLPGWYRRPVAVAADVYRGIHDEIRANDYDNLTRRAYTGLTAKIRLGAGALFRAHLSGGGRVEPARSPRSSSTAQARVALGIATLLAAIPLAAVPGPAAAQEQPQRSAAGEPAPSRWAQPSAPIPDAAWDRALRSVGTLWVEAVEREAAVATGLEAVETVRSRFAPLPPDRDRLLRAYRGSFLALRARHGGGPRQRLRDLRGGFELMDAAVAESPEAPGLRYVRLMSGFYLPAIFGRREEVRRDMETLIRLLPRARSAFPPALYPEVVRFVLEHGDPADAARLRLEALLP